MLTIGVPREIQPGEQRVAATPETVAKLAATGAAVVVETGAGTAAGHPDDAYAKAGARIAADAATLYGEARLILKVREPLAREVDSFAPDSALVCFLALDRQPDLLERLRARNLTAFAMERIPRTTRAQRMDALSSMSTVAGYKAVLLGATTLGRFFPLLMTAAGTIAPARVFVLGAGVAGLQAIATARRLGAVVEAFDVRPAVREEVQSLGATFVAAELADVASVAAGGYAKAQSQDQEQRTRASIRPHVAQADVVVATANVPGRRAPVLVSADMVREMKPGSVIVDLAAEGGGNCELTRPGETTVAHGITLIGAVNLASTLPFHASQMYARNVLAFAQLLVREGSLKVDFADDILDATCVTHAGQSRLAGAAPAPAVALAATEARS